jgi:6-phosphogluconolactonase
MVRRITITVLHRPPQRREMRRSSKPNPADAHEIAYVGSRTSRHREGKGIGLEVFSVPSDNAPWQRLQTLRLDNPTFLLLSPDSSKLYVTHGDATSLSVLAIEPTSGTVSEHSSVDSGGVNPVHFTLSPDGRFVVVANHNSGTVASLPVLTDGSLGTPASVLELIGENGPHRRDQNGPKPHQVVFDATGRFALVPDKGTDSIYTIEIDDDGNLTMDPGRTVRLREMSGPRHVVFSPDGLSAYSIEEFRSTVTRFDWDSSRGRLTARQVVSSLPEDMTGESRAGEIAIDSSGRYLYASNRGGPGDASPGGFFPDTIGIFTLARDGRLTEPRWHKTLGIRPRFFCIDPTGRTLLVAHERGHTIAAHAISPDTGDLGDPVTLAETGSPVAILRHRLPAGESTF